MIVDSIAMTLPVSVILEDCCEIKDVCLSLPCVISRRGVKQSLNPELSDDERMLLQLSAAAVRKLFELTKQTRGPL
jgi:L-lactate dehydrogenase